MNRACETNFLSFVSIFHAQGTQNMPSQRKKYTVWRGCEKRKQPPNKNSLRETITWKLSKSLLNIEWVFIFAKLVECINKLSRLVRPPFSERQQFKDNAKKHLKWKRGSFWEGKTERNDWVNKVVAVFKKTCALNCLKALV